MNGDPGWTILNEVRSTVDTLIQDTSSSESQTTIWGYCYLEIVTPSTIFRPSFLEAKVAKPIWIQDKRNMSVVCKELGENKRRGVFAVCVAPLDLNISADCQDLLGQYNMIDAWQALVEQNRFDTKRMVMHTVEINECLPGFTLKIARPRSTKRLTAKKMTKFLEFGIQAAVADSKDNQIVVGGFLPGCLLQNADKNEDHITLENANQNVQLDCSIPTKVTFLLSSRPYC